MKQRDFLIEAEDNVKIGSSRELKAIVDGLPVKTLLNVFEVIEPVGPLAVSENTIYAWIQAGKFSVINAGGKDKMRYKIFRYSLIEFLAKRVISGGGDAK